MMKKAYFQAFSSISLFSVKIHNNHQRFQYFKYFDHFTFFVILKVFLEIFQNFHETFYLFSHSFTKEVVKIKADTENKFDGKRKVF